MSSEETFFWNLYAKCYDAVNYTIPYRGLLWESLEKLDLKPGQKILDAGCGTGNFEKFLEEKGITDVKIEAVDFSSSMLNRAKRKCDGLPNVNIAQADLNEGLDFSDNSFDGIVSINVLYALKDPSFTISELSRVLKPKGKVVLTTPRDNAQFAPIIGDHFKRIKNIWGAFSRAFVLIRTMGIIPTLGLVPIILNVFIIKKKGHGYKYHFVSKKFLEKILMQNKLKDACILSTYGAQNWLVVATKK